MRKVFLFIFIAFVASCKVDYQKNDEQSNVVEQKNFVKIELISTKTEPVPIQAIGRLGSDQEVRLSFKVGGFVSTIKVREGDYVRKGSLLGRIRTTEIDAQVLKADQALQKAERDLKRVKNMFADSVATAENVDDLTTLVQVSKADFKIAKFNQKFSKIISPVNGRVIRRMAEPNELVSPGQPVLMIAASSGDAYVLKVALSDKDINRVKLGNDAYAKFDAFPNDTFTGKVSNISESSDPMTGTFEIEINLNTQKKRLRNGYIGQVEIEPLVDDPYLEIPIQAIVEGDNKVVTIFVPSQSDTIAREIKVQPFHITNNSIFIKQPEGEHIEKVVTVGAAYLVDGDRIYIK